MDEEDLEFFRSEPLPLAEEVQRFADNLGMFDQPPHLLIETGSNDPNSDFYDLSSPLWSVVRENEMKLNKYRLGDSTWNIYITTLIADRSSSVRSIDDRKTSDILKLLKICRLAKRWTYTDLAWSTALRTRTPESVSRKALMRRQCGVE